MVFGGYDLTDDINIDYIYDTSHVNGAVVYAPFSSPVLLVDNQRYLVCLNTFSGTDSVSFGYDNVLDYAANISIYDQPVAALNVDNQWFSGWKSADAATIGLKLAYDVGVIEDNTHSGILYPNPANDNVSVVSNENGQLNILDMSGRIVFTESLISNTRLNVSISDLPTGVYQINLVSEQSSKTEKLIISH